VVRGKKQDNAGEEENVMYGTETVIMLKKESTSKKRKGEKRGGRKWGGEKVDLKGSFGGEEGHKFSCALQRSSAGGGGRGSDK